MLRLTRQQWLSIVAEAWQAYPLEACGVLIGKPGGDVHRFVSIKNAAASARVYSLDGREFSKAALRADKDGLDIVGVVHSHTHTLAFPSATDVAEGTKPLVSPDWHWPIISLAWGYPELRSFKLVREETSSGQDSSTSQIGIVEEEVRLCE